MSLPNTSERNYKAFISYRHRPLDLSVAKKLHRRIERYMIPKEVRRGGRKKLGLVFRDQDELPIANNLTENIRIALDHSEFLIVVCTPDTPHSEWVNREIAYFLEHHSRDNVLAVLAAGEPDQSFPKPLTEVQNETGDVIETIEPLAANIVADSEIRRNRLFKTESLRILASLIGCPYDTLYRREQRYKMRRMGLVGAGIAVVAAAFIGLLINRNAKIQEQLTTAQINESRTLSALSKTALRSGDFRSALENALDALPGRNPSRPYVPEAEKALSKCLNPYKRGYETMSYLQSVSQDTEIRRIAASDNGEYFVTADDYGQIRLYDLSSCSELWKTKYDAGYTSLPDRLFFLGKSGVLAFSDHAKNVLYSLEDGSTLWESENFNPMMYAFNEKNGVLFSVYSPSGADRTEALLIDGKNGETMRNLEVPEELHSNTPQGAISADARYAATFMQDSGGGTNLILFDFETGRNHTIDSVNYHVSAHYEFRFTDADELVLICCGSEKFVDDGNGWEGCYVSLYDPEKNWTKRFQTFLDFGTENRGSFGLVDMDSYVDYCECGENMIAVSSRNRLIALEKENGSIRWQNDLPSYIVNAKLFSGDNVMLVLHNGLVTMAFASNGTLSATSMLAYFEAGYDLSLAAISPTEKPFTSRYLLVSSEQPYLASLVGLHDSRYLTLIEDSDTGSGSSRWFVSPDKSKAVEINIDNNTLRYNQIDLALTEPAKSGEVKLPDRGSFSLFFDENRNLLTNNGRMIFCGLSVDFGTGQASYLSIDPETAPKKSNKNLSCLNQETLSVLTASMDQDAHGTVHLLLWKDGEQTKDVLLPFWESDPYGTSSYDVLSIGENGYAVMMFQKEYQGEYNHAVYSIAEDRFVSCPFFDPASEETMALAQKHPWMALQKSDGELCLIDLSSGKEFRKIESDLPVPSVAKMIFFSEDECLAVFSKKGDMRIYRTSDGRELHRSNHVDSNLRFSSTACYQIEKLPEENRLLIFLDDTSYREPGCFIFDLDTYEIVGTPFGLSAWLPEEKKILIRGYPNGLYLSPLLSTEELLSLGEEVLEKGFQE